jgi:LemA protein
MEVNTNHYILVGFIYLLLYVLSIFLRLFVLRRNVRRSWSKLDMLLKQRFDALIALVGFCEIYVMYDNLILNAIRHLLETIEEAVVLRDLEKIKSSAYLLEVNMSELYVSISRFPAIQSSENYSKLHSKVKNLNELIKQEMKEFNEMAEVYNVTCSKFPDATLAALLKFKTVDGFEEMPPKIKRGKMKRLF